MVLSASLPLLAQENPYNEVLLYTRYTKYSIWGVECTLAVIGTGGPVKQSRSTVRCVIMIYGAME
eukprot:1094428-Prorocentrum_minimum.AAC.2